MNIKILINSKVIVCLILILLSVLEVTSKGFDGSAEKYRICIVESRGAYKRGVKYCPILEKKSNIECVIGLDRLDCVRKIQKGTAHFGVFSSEDLVAARWAGVEILVTSELRFHNTPFEYEIVAIVDNEAGINTAQDLRGSRFCHPGYGLQTDWTEILANYFESTLVARQCESDLSLTESRIKASASFFGPTCKAGPWVPDPVQDKVLKTRYPSLCQLCYDQYQCGVGDKHWGRRGPLYCLTSGAGQVAWARLDDVKSHFGFSGLPREANPSSYSYLCPDGHLQPMNTNFPCVWVAKPWPAVAARRNLAEKIQLLLDNLSHEDIDSWENALLSLMESYHVNVTALDMAIPINDYLDQAVGFQSAYSFPSCSPPRSIIYCTTSLIQHAKCSWLQEAAGVYGIEPNLQCVRTDSSDRCFNNVKHRTADIVHVEQNDRIRAQRDYNLRPLLFEYSKKLENRYVIVAVVKQQSSFKSFNDLKGKKACFPNYEGPAYLSVIETIRNLSLVSSSCPYSSEISDYFSHDSCTFGPNNKCENSYEGEEGSLRCLFEGGGDVAFVGLDIYENFTTGNITSDWAKKLHSNVSRLLCPYGTDNKYTHLCYLHWTTRAQLMINNENELMRKNEIYNSLREMDRLFGKQYKSHTLPFTLFGEFDKKQNIMFSDVTDGFRGIVEIQKDKYERGLELIYDKYLLKNCTKSPNKADLVFTKDKLIYIILTGLLINLITFR